MIGIYFEKKRFFFKGFITELTKQIIGVFSCKIHSSSGQMDTENVVFPGCGRRDQPETDKIGFK